MLLSKVLKIRNVKLPNDIVFRLQTAYINCLHTDTIHSPQIDVITRKRFPQYYPFDYPFGKKMHLPVVDFSQSACDAELWCFLRCLRKQNFEQTIELSAIWNAMMLMGRHNNNLKFPSALDKLYWKKLWYRIFVCFSMFHITI